MEDQIGQLDQEMANLLSQHQDAVQRLAEVPGLGVDSAQQIIAEVGPTAATFPSAKQRGCELQPPVAEGQPPHAADSQPGGQCRRQKQRKHLRDYVSPLRPALGT
jgi:hypothetical protein